MNPYKLAFVIERYFEFGGLQRNMLRLALACAKEGHDVTVFTGRWEGPQYPSLNIEIVDFQAFSNHSTIKKMEAFVYSLKQKNEFDAITGFNRVCGLDVYYSGDVCLKAKLQQQNRLWLRFLPRYRSYLQLEESVFGQTADCELMLISPIQAMNFREVYNTVTKRIHLLPPGIDREQLSDPFKNEERKSFRMDLGIGDNEFLILTVGSSFHTKGIDRTIFAIAALPDELKKCCHYVVVGQGKAKKFQAIANQAGIGNQIHFTGGRNDISNFYYAADLLVHPARTENTGNTLLEAMVTGLPVIATGNCGYAYYIENANGGQICPHPFDPKQLNTLLRQILSDDERLMQYGQNGKNYCQTADIYSRIEMGAEIIIDRAKKNRGSR